MRSLADHNWIAFTLTELLVVIAIITESLQRCSCQHFRLPRPEHSERNVSAISINSELACM